MKSSNLLTIRGTHSIEEDIFDSLKLIVDRYKEILPLKDIGTLIDYNNYAVRSSFLPKCDWELKDLYDDLGLYKWNYIIVGNFDIDLLDYYGIDQESYQLTKQPVLLKTSIRFIPQILKNIGVAKSTSEVKRSRPSYFTSIPDNYRGHFVIKYRDELYNFLAGVKEEF